MVHQPFRFLDQPFGAVEVILHSGQDLLTVKLAAEEDPRNFLIVSMAKLITPLHFSTVERYESGSRRGAAYISARQLGSQPSDGTCSLSAKLSANEAAQSHTWATLHTLQMPHSPVFLRRGSALTRKRSLVQIQYRPPVNTPSQARFATASKCAHAPRRGSC